MLSCCRSSKDLWYGKCILTSLGSDFIKPMRYITMSLISRFYVQHALHAAASPGEVSSRCPNTPKPYSCSPADLMRKKRLFEDRQLMLNWSPHWRMSQGARSPSQHRVKFLWLFQLECCVFNTSDDIIQRNFHWKWTLNANRRLLSLYRPHCWGQTVVNGMLVLFSGVASMCIKNQQMRIPDWVR